MKKYWKGFLAGGIAVLCTNGIMVQGPRLIQRIFDELNHGVTHGKLLTWCWLLLAVAAGKGVFQFLTRWIMIGISREIEFDLRNDLFLHLEALDFGFYQRTRTGDIMARATNDLNAVRMLLGPAIMYSANTVVFTVAALFFMIRVSPRLTLWAFLPLPIASILVQYFGTRIHERFERIQAKFSDISARAQENFSGARLIRAYAQEEAEIALFERENTDYINRSLPLARLMGMLWPTLEVMLGFALVIVLWVGGQQVLQGRITPGQFVEFNMYMLMLSWPIIALGWVINIFQRGTASMERIDEILRQKPTIADDPSSLTVPAEAEIRGEIEFRDLSFAYDFQSTLRDAALSSSVEPGAPVLHNVNLRIPAGTSLAFVGPTGSGKSTLVSLIPRINDAAPGSILIDGRPIREYPLQTLRRQIGFVPQETFLFSATIRENIAFGVEDATTAQVRRAAEISRIERDVEGFPEKYETMVGERGLTLSGGQKQRVAIARAVIREPRILVLDDALASVDTHTEDQILNGLRELMKGRTTIFISHRVSTVRNADHIAVLHHGHIVEYGTHDELLALNGYYTDLHDKQLLEEELETA
ncbi:MAG: ABC transporter ATP-binding protein [Candidatus Korobacteraceae bacterium]|jgi:ATP-binding cassette subfamily B protein